MKQEIFTVNELRAKVKSKRELFRTLATEGEVMLPPMKDTNKHYLQGIMTGTKKVNPFTILSVFL